MMTAKEFCEIKDKNEGEGWSNDYIALPEAMEDYALVRMITFLKECPPDMFVSEVLNDLQERDEIEKIKKYL